MTWFFRPDSYLVCVSIQVCLHVCESVYVCRVHERLPVGTYVVPCVVGERVSPHAVYDLYESVRTVRPVCDVVCLAYGCVRVNRSILRVCDVCLYVSKRTERVLSVYHPKRVSRR